MGIVDKIGGKTFRRTSTSIDKTIVYTDGFINQFGPSSSDPAGQDIPTIIGNSGTITLSRTYVPGRRNLTVIVDGVTLINEGASLANNDYVEVDNRTIQLGTGVLAALNPTTSYIRIIWNRPLPGIRDQNLSNLKNVDEDLEDAILDPLNLRALAASATNPLATLADGGGGGSGAPLEGLTVVPQDPNNKLVSSTTTGASADFNIFVDFSLSGVTPPTGATHAIVTVLLDVGADTAFTSGGNVTTFIGPYIADPTPYAGIPDLEVTQISLLETSENNATNTGVKIVPLNVPADPSGDLSLRVDLDGLTTINVTHKVWVEGWLIEEIGSAPSPVSFYASKSATGQAASFSGAQINTWDSPDFNVGGGFDSSTGTFTAPIGGKYHFDLGVGFHTQVASNQIQCSIRKNGAEVARQVMVANNTGGENAPTLHTSVLVDLAIGDTVAGFAGTDNSGSFAGPTAATTHFSGFLLAAAGGVPLDGLTAVPVHQRVANIASTGGATATKSSIDLAVATGAAVPANATHALFRMGLRLADTGLSPQLNVDGYLSNASIDPFGTAPEQAEANIDNLVVGPDLPSASGSRSEFQMGTVLIPINSAAPHVYYWAGENTGTYAGTGSYDGDIWLEAYYVEEIASVGADTVTSQATGSHAGLGAAPDGPINIYNQVVPTWAKFIDISIAGGDNSSPGNVWACDAEWTIDVDAYTISGSSAAWSGTAAGLTGQSQNGLDLTGLVGGGSPFVFAFISGIFDSNLAAYSGPGTNLTIDYETFQGGSSAMRCTVRYRTD